MGTSLELKGCQAGLEATQEIAEAAYAEGFDVDLDYGDSYRRWYPQRDRLDALKAEK